MHHPPPHGQLTSPPAAHGSATATARSGAADGQVQGSRPEPGTVFACIDASDFMPSVCHHAAWLSERLGASLRLLHASTASNPRGRILLRAAERLADEGLPPPEGELVRGTFIEAAAGHAGAEDVLVLGRRGRASHRRADGFGANVVPLIRRSVAAVLLAPRLFMPVSRVLVRPIGEQAADRRLHAYVDRALAGMEIAAARTDEIDMICCPRELVCAPQPGQLDALFGARRPVLIV